MNVDDPLRVKHDPSLGDAGFHARLNPEVVGGIQYPFQFEARGVVVKVPNPVTWTIMKLTAMRDCWLRSNEADRRETDRQFWTSQADKHAQDVFRIAAMVTSDERDQISDIVPQINTSDPFLNAQQIVADHFKEQSGRGIQTVQRMWSEPDLKLVQQVLCDWYV